MLIIWGNKTVRKQRGFAVDFCTMCRDVSPIRVIEFKVAAHLYGVGLGSGRTQTFLSECLHCGFLQPTDRTRYESLEKRRPDSIDELEAKTFPNVRSVFGQRLETEEAILNGVPLEAEKRRDLIREPFARIAEEVDTDEGIYKRTDTRSLWIAIGTFLIPTTVFIGAASVEDQDFGELLAIVGFGLFAIGLCTTLFRIGTRRTRFFRQKLRPMIDRALAPLNPTEVELDETITWLRGLGFKFAKKFQVEGFRDRVQLHELGPQGRTGSRVSQGSLNAPSRDQRASTYSR